MSQLLWLFASGVAMVISSYEVDVYAVGPSAFCKQVCDMYLISFVNGYVNPEACCKGAVTDAECLHIFLSV